jgi:hypothetical protein
MHGFLWSLHADHHNKDHDSWFERNDAFFIFYAVVSIGCFLLWKNNILEIGAGRGEFYEFIHKDFENYFMTDISEWGKEHVLDLATKDPRIKFDLQNIENINYEDSYFD